MHQLMTLEKFFALDPTWSKETISYIQEFMPLTRLQLYKWGYDQKRKSSCKTGIRNKRRDSLRNRMSSSKSLDYNLMVDDLLEGIKPSNNPIQVNSEMFEQLKQKFLAQKKSFQEVHLVTADETPISDKDESECHKIDRVELLLSDHNDEKKDEYDTLIEGLKQLPSLREVASQEIGEFRYFA